ncbi:MAG: histidine phosphatase family protein [Bacteroidetes bacterium]|nr:histidine phosphatase family protein [Bacteroidota bacterium]MBP9135588.1 histidine phosphatase family protein [Chitinophagales bacterium]MBK7504320.1 histidine phosphatase family protein [Bacteroidota bacterium]MBK7639776.1 histidine phosphatase family protein [Bacteroidota bacterium]MBK8672420.1 histidine phosphatase family protein [Bacteroidota bacterium]
MKKEIYIIRHGQTDYNLKGIVQGRGVDSVLNETGEEQAKKFHEKYKEHDFDVVFTSTLQRTHQTVKPFTDNGLEKIISIHLDEIDWGIYEGMEPTPEMLKNYTGIIKEWREGNLDIKIHGGESAQDLYDRQFPFVEELKNLKASKVLICSHGRAIRSLLCCFLNVPLKDMDNFEHHNTCLYKINYNGKKFELEISNDISHLS